MKHGAESTFQLFIYFCCKKPRFIFLNGGKMNAFGHFSKFGPVAISQN